MVSLLDIVGYTIVHRNWQPKKICSMGSQKLCSMGVVPMVLILERMDCLLEVEFCFPKLWLYSDVAREP